MDSKLAAYFDAAVKDGSAPSWSGTYVTSDSVAPVICKGVANVESKAAVDDRSVYWYASGSKLYIALSVLKLLDTGAIKDMNLETGLDDAETLAKYLPELKVGGGHPVMQIFEGWEGDPEDRKMKTRPAKVPVTLRHLLTFTAGSFGHLFDSDVMKMITPTVKAPEALAANLMTCKMAGLNTPRNTEAGAPDSYGYGGAGQDLVGLFLARTTGKTQRQVVRELVLDPLGLGEDEVNHYLDESMRARMIDIHVPTLTGWTPIPNDVPSWHWQNGPPTAEDQEFGNAAMCGTLSAYAKTLQAVLARSPKLLSPKAWDLALADDLLSRKDKVTIPAPLWDGLAAPEASARTAMEVDDVGTTLLQSMINRHETPSGCQPGTLEWAGLANLYWWADFKQNVGGVIATQTLPFHAEEIMTVVRGYKRLINDNVASIKA